MNVQRFEKNQRGKDFIVGDIHGNFTLLEGELARIGFNAEKDRLFSVGDLVDRGPESSSALEWVAKPWFFPVRGNHEDMAIDWASGIGDRDMYRANGGAWMMASTDGEQQDFKHAFMCLPIAIELETKEGIVGIVHADCPRKTWQDFTKALESPEDDMESSHLMAMAIWNRQRIEFGDCSGVAGVRAVVAGHTPVQEVTVLGNVHHIDTGGWLKGIREWARFTILDAETLEAV